MARVRRSLEAHWINLELCLLLSQESFRVRLIIELKFLLLFAFLLTHLLGDLEPDCTRKFRIVLKCLLIESVGVHFQEVYLVVESIWVEEQFAELSSRSLPYRLETLVLFQVFLHIERCHSFVN